MEKGKADFEEKDYVINLRLLIDNKIPKISGLSLEIKKIKMRNIFKPINKLFL